MENRIWEEWSREKIDRERAYWVSFSVFAGIGGVAFGKLLRYFGGAKEAWEAGEADLRPILGDKLYVNFQRHRRKHNPVSYLRTLKTQTTASGLGEIYALMLSEKEYPSFLREIDNPPFVLYVLGDPAVLLKPQIAVVGTRRMTGYGAKVTRELVSGLVDSGFVITSGLAYGIDTEAHRAALRSGGGTIAVLGCGVDICYPREHYKDYKDIISKGAVVSEIPPGIRASRGIFVARNRLISGLSLGVLVVEGAEKSGTLITAGYAAQQGREVFAVPGPITSEVSRGPIRLIREGAKVVCGVEDILEEIKGRGLGAGSGSWSRGGDFELTKMERMIVDILGEVGDRADIDTIIRKTGLGSGEAGGILSGLEIKGIVRVSGSGEFYLG